MGRLRFAEAAPPWRWQAVRILGGCALAYGLAALTGLPDRFWAMITAVVVTQPAFDATLAAGRDRIFGTLVGAAVGLAAIELAGGGPPPMPLFWAAMALLALLTALQPSLRLSCITLIVGDRHLLDQSIEERGIRAIRALSKFDLVDRIGLAIAQFLAGQVDLELCEHREALRWKTPFKAITHAWTADPSKFRINPRHIIPGPNT